MKIKNVNLLLYFLYPHLVIILLLLCFSIAVMWFSFGSIGHVHKYQTLWY